METPKLEGINYLAELEQLNSNGAVIACGIFFHLMLAFVPQAIICALPNGLA